MSVKIQNLSDPDLIVRFNEALKTQGFRVVAPGGVRVAARNANLAGPLPAFAFSANRLLAQAQSNAGTLVLQRLGVDDFQQLVGAEVGAEGDVQLLLEREIDTLSKALLSLMMRIRPKAADKQWPADNAVVLGLDELNFYWARIEREPEMPPVATDAEPAQQQQQQQQQAEKAPKKPRTRKPKEPAPASAAEQPAAAAEPMDTGKEKKKKKKKKQKKGKKDKSKAKEKEKGSKLPKGADKKIAYLQEKLDPILFDRPHLAEVWNNVLDATRKIDGAIDGLATPQEGEAMQADLAEAARQYREAKEKLENEKDQKQVDKDGRVSELFKSLKAKLDRKVLVLKARGFESLGEQPAPMAVVDIGDSGSSSSSSSSTSSSTGPDSVQGSQETTMPPSASQSMQSPEEQAKAMVREHIQKMKEAQAQAQAEAQAQTTAEKSIRQKVDETSPNRDWNYWELTEAWVEELQDAPSVEHTRFLTEFAIPANQMAQRARDIIDSLRLLRSLFADAATTEHRLQALILDEKATIHLRHLARDFSEQTYAVLMNAIKEKKDAAEDAAEDAAIAMAAEEAEAAESAAAHAEAQARVQAQAAAEAEAKALAAAQAEAEAEARAEEAAAAVQAQAQAEFEAVEAEAAAAAAKAKAEEELAARAQAQARADAVVAAKAAAVAKAPSVIQVREQSPDVDYVGKKRKREDDPELVPPAAKRSKPALFSRDGLLDIIKGLERYIGDLMQIHPEQWTPAGCREFLNSLELDHVDDDNHARERKSASTWRRAGPEPAKRWHVVEAARLTRCKYLLQACVAADVTDEMDLLSNESAFHAELAKAYKSASDLEKTFMYCYDVNSGIRHVIDSPLGFWQARPKYRPNYWVGYMRMLAAHFVEDVVRLSPELAALRAKYKAAESTKPWQERTRDYLRVAASAHQLAQTW
jgi:hypothetical protein